MVAGYDTKVLVDRREPCLGMTVASLPHCSSTYRPVGYRCYGAELRACRIGACGELLASSSVSYNCIVRFVMFFLLLRPPEMS